MIKTGCKIKPLQNIDCNGFIFEKDKIYIVAFINGDTVYLRENKKYKGKGVSVFLVKEVGKIEYIKDVFKSAIR